MSDSKSEALLKSSKYYAELSDFSSNYVQLQYYQWLNATNGTLSAWQLSAISNDYFYMKYVEIVCTYAQAYMFVIFSAVGFFGYIIQSILLMDSEFKAVTFWYQKSEVWLELVHMIFLFFNGLSNLIPAANQTFWWVYFSANLSNVFNKILILTTDVITFFVCLERFVAILLPLAFDSINNRRFALSALCISILAGWLFGVDFIKYEVKDTANGPVLTQNPDFSRFSDYIKFRDAFQLAKGYVICFLSLMLVFGLIKISRKRLTTGTNADKVKRKANIQICILSICYGIPVTINSMIYVVYNQWFPASAVSISTAVISKPYEECIRLIHSERTRAWLMLMVNLSMCLAHCLHFYTNLLFSPMFRRVFDDRAKKLLIRLGWKFNSVTNGLEMVPTRLFLPPTIPATEFYALGPNFPNESHA